MACGAERGSGPSRNGGVAYKPHLGRPRGHFAASNKSPSPVADCPTSPAYGNGVHDADQASRAKSSDTCGGRRSGVMHAKLVFSPTPPLAPVAKVLVSGHTPSVLRREVVNAACRHSVESKRGLAGLELGDIQGMLLASARFTCGRSSFLSFGHLTRGEASYRASSTR